MGDAGEAEAEAEPDEEPNTDDHPLVVAMRQLLGAMHGQQGRGLRGSIEDAAILAHGTASSGAEGDHETAAEGREDLQEQLAEAEDKQGLFRPQLREVWDAALACRDEEASPNAPATLGEADVEELVLAHLCAFPEFLGRTLVRRLVQQVALGQGFLDAEDKHLDVSILLRHLDPHLPSFLALSNHIAEESCKHLIQRSESMASRALRTLDLDRDGVVCEAEFLKAAPHAFALEIENVAVQAAVAALLGNPDFADVFHPAMAHALHIVEE
mmetsp:Transcript_702/g.2231  ORF Transcript_702/g.2231 Transcript_702/m.2231 type:complete len:270 (+) Transcript_702:93-902(+)